MRKRRRRRTQLRTLAHSLLPPGALLPAHLFERSSSLYSAQLVRTYASWCR